MAHSLCNSWRVHDGTLDCMTGAQIKPVALYLHMVGPVLRPRHKARAVYV